MKYFIYFLQVNALASLFCFSATIFAQEEKESKFKITTYEDFILWAGHDFHSEFDPNLIKDEKLKKSALKDGLKIVGERAKEGDRFNQECLAVYYFIEHDYRKSLYWALKSAEQGSSAGMEILACAYANGKGVLEDSEESIKWFILGEAVGGEQAKRFLVRIRTEYKDFDTWDFVKQGKLKAKEWMEKHPEAFFSPD